LLTEYVNRALVIHQLHRRLLALGALGDVLNVEPVRGSVLVHGVAMLQETNPSPLNWLVPPVRYPEAVDIVWEEATQGAATSLDWLGMTREQGLAPDTVRWFGDGRSPRTPNEFMPKLLLLAARSAGVLPVLSPSSMHVRAYAITSDSIQSAITGRRYHLGVGRMPSWQDLSLPTVTSSERLPLALEAAGVVDDAVWWLARSALDGFNDLEQESFEPSRTSWRLGMPVVVPGVPADVLSPAKVAEPGARGFSSDEIERLLAEDMVDVAALYRASVPGACSARVFHRHIDPNPTSGARLRRVRPETRRVWSSLLLTGDHHAI
jgi:hypothetical protein